MLRVCVCVCVCVSGQPSGEERKVESDSEETNGRYPENNNS